MVNANILNYYERNLNQYILDIFYNGLDENDYKEITIILKQLKALKRLGLYSKEIEALQADFYKIHQSIEKEVMPITLKDELIRTGSLLHMVYANNESDKIKMYSDASVMFSCQFHNERTPSFGVIDSVGKCFCFGCGISLNIINYVMEYENLSYHETVQLLSRIYMININDNMVDENNEKVTKYKNALLSNEFNELLINLNDRITRREEKTGETMSSKLAKEKINHNFETIERIRKEEYKDFISNKNKQKRLRFEIPNFN